MKIEMSRKALKVIGVLTVVGAVLTMAFGGLVGAGANIESVGAELAKSGINSTDVAAIAGIMVFAGIFLLIEGMIDIKASKDSRFCMAASVLAVLGLVGSLGQAVTTVANKGFAGSELIGVVISLAINAVIFAAANTVRNAHREGGFEAFA